MKKLLSLFLLFLCSFDAAALEMKTVDIKELNLTIEVPSDFTKMPDSLSAIKYPSKNRPQVVYSNESGSVSFGVSVKDKPDSVFLDDLDEIKDLMLESMKVFNPEASPLIVDGNNAWLITFKSQAIDSKVLNMQLITLTEKNFVIATFNMTEKNITEYQGVGLLSLSSMKFK